MSSKLRQSGLFAGLERTELDEFLEWVQPESCTFKQGVELWHEGDTIIGIGVITNGHLFCQCRSCDGDVSIERDYEAGDIIGAVAALSTEQMSPETLVAASDGSYLWFEKDLLLSCLEAPRKTLYTLYRNLFAYLTEETQKLADCVNTLEMESSPN